MSIPREIVRLQVRIETIAEQHSRPGKSGLGLDETLAGLDLTGRRQPAGRLGPSGAILRA